MARFHCLDVVDVRRETRDAVVVTLKPRDEDAGLFDFTQGQYLTFRRRFDDEELRRSYSICAGKGEGFLQVGIKRVDGGAFSTWANEEPAGRRGAGSHAADGQLPHPARSRRDQALSGLRRRLGHHARSSRSSRPCSRPSRKSSFTLVYANRQISTIMFREDLEDLKNRYLGRLSVLHVLESEAQEIDLFTGRVDAAKCAALFKAWIDLASVDTAFICGPEPMMLAIAGALKEHGLADGQIKFELFASGQPGRGQEARGEHRRRHLELDDRGHDHARRRHPHLPHAEGGHEPARRRARRPASTRPTPARPASARPAAPRCWRARSRWP